MAQGTGKPDSASRGGPLAGLRIVDFSHYLAGPLATMLLADFGAEVIRVDPPGGPRWRHPANACLHRGKRSIVLDLKAADDLARAKELIGSADVVVEGFRPGVMARLGLDPERLRAEHPRLIWCALPGFPSDDPRAGMQGWEGVVCAAAALYPLSQHETTGGPLFSAIPYASNFAGFVAAHSIVAAVIARQRSGAGDHIEVALFDAAAEAIAMGFEVPRGISKEEMFSVFGLAGIRNQAEHRLYRCRDGRYVRRDIPLRGLHNFWDRYMPAGLKDDPSDEAGRQAEAMLERLFLTRDAQDWERIGQTELQAAFATHLSSSEWLQDEHARDSGTVVLIDDPELGRIAIPGIGVKVGNQPASVGQPRRLAGADTESAMAELAAARPAAPTPSPADQGPSGLPLAGVRMLDFSNLIAGPTAGRILARYGAEVIKVSRVALARGKPNLASDEPFAFVGHRTTSLGKKSVFFELSAEGAPEVLARLVRSADIVHHNFSIAAAARYGLGDDDLRAFRPDLICSTVRVHGSGGWREGFRGHEQIAQSTTGMTIRFGSPEAPVELEMLNNDYATAHLSVLGMLVALVRREQDPTFCAVEAALSRTATLCQIPYMVDPKAGPVIEPTGTTALGWTVWNRLYRCRDGWLFLAAQQPCQRQLVAQELGIALPPGDPDDDGMAARLEAAFAGRTSREVTGQLQGRGVAAHVYAELADLLAAPDRIARGLLARLDHPGLQPGLSIGRVGRFASRPEDMPTGSVRPGLHTREILGGLGYSDQEIDGLMARQIVAGPVAPGTAFTPV